MSAISSRGYRNRNPGNIDWSPANNWQGQIGREQSGNSPRFAVFESHEFGIRALIALLTTYQNRHNLRTISQIIGRWAPTNENNTSAYVAHVSRLTGFAPNDRLDMRLYEHARPLVEAIIIHELGGNPYTGTEIDDGLELYGVVKGVQRPVETMREAATTGTGQGAITVGAAASAASIAAPAIQAFGNLSPWVSIAVVLATAAVAVAVVLTRRRTA